MVVDLTAEHLDAPAIRHALRYRCLPTLDGTPPRADALRALALETAAFEGSIYIHCAAGRGRAATFAVALLLARGLEPDALSALARLRRARPGVRLLPRQRRLVERLDLGSAGAPR